MTRGLHRRLVTLQVARITMLGVGAGLLFWSSSFITGMVYGPRPAGAPQIYFRLPALGLEARPYAGLKVDDGVRAKAYADAVIGPQLEQVGGARRTHN